MQNSTQSILIVDDSPLIRERLTQILDDTDCVGSISIAGDYDEAIKQLAEKKIDIVLLDIHLPGKNGIELLQFINKNYPAIKVIMLTNQASDFYRNLCAKEGAAHFIDKSKEFESIPEVVASLV